MSHTKQVEDDLIYQKKMTGVRSMEEKNARELPIGFTMNLAMNEKAMKAFSNMDEMQKRNVEEESRRVKSKNEMENLVNRLAQEEMRCRQ
ncbi:MAG: hypothetical protein ACI4F1_02500 [Bariatricus sp.]